MKHIITNPRRLSSLLFLVAAMLMGQNAWADDITIFSLSGITGPTGDIASKATVDVEATVTGGTVKIYNGKGSAATMVNSSGITVGGSSNSYCHITLTTSYTFQENDVITITNKDEKTNDFYLSSSNTKGTETMSDASYTIGKGSEFIGEQHLYIWKGSSTKTINAVTITRPSTGAVYTVTYDATTNGGSCSKSSETQSAEGAAVTLPDAQKEDRSLIGWATSASEPTTVVGAAGKTYTPSKDITLYAIFGFVFDESAEEAVTTANINAAKGKTDKVQIKRTFYKGGVKNTICLPFSLTSEGVESSPLAGCTIKELSTETEATVKNKGTANQVIKPTYTDASAIEAGKPYIISWEESSSGNIVDPVFSNVTIPSNVAVSSTKSGDVTLCGTFTQKSVTSGQGIMFLNSEGILKWPNAGGSIKGFRCYFTVE